MNRKYTVHYFMSVVPEGQGYGYEARLVVSDTVNGDDARIEVRSLMLDDRVSSLERRASIGASRTVNVKPIT
jgi:hypothetical protein